VPNLDPLSSGSLSEPEACSKPDENHPLSATGATSQRQFGIWRQHVSDFVFAFLDCEFGGLDVEAHDITEVGILMTDYRLAELSTGHWRVQFRQERSTLQAREIFGYDEALWADATPIHQTLEQISELCPAGKKVVPAGQNVRMDVMFLERAYKQCDLPYPFDYHVIDLANLFYAWSLVAG